MAPSEGTPERADQELRSRIPELAHGMPLLDYLAQRFPYLDRDAWRTEIAAGRLSIDGRRASAVQVLRAGRSLAWRRQQLEPEVDRRCTILHEDAGIVVVDKPAHLPMHADGPFVANTLIQIVRASTGVPDLHLVHRLDRETSGVCVLARTSAARDALRSQFAAGTVRKTYVALVRGCVESDVVIDRPIGHSADSTISLRRSASANAREPRAASTFVEVLGCAPDRTLVRCTPATGRTHQIRVHLEAAGTPVLGDKLYGRPDADYLAFVARVKAGGAPGDAPSGEPGRHLLHAAEISFVHPGTGASVSFKSPLPDDFGPWLTGLQRLPGR